MLRSPQGALGLDHRRADPARRRSSGRWLAPYDPEKIGAAAALQAAERRSSGSAPTSSAATSSAACSHGARATVVMAVLATALGTLAGAVIGTVSAFLGGRVDEAIMRTVDAVMSIPSLLLALLIVNAARASSSINALLAIAHRLHARHGAHHALGRARGAQAGLRQRRDRARRERGLHRRARDAAERRSRPIIVEMTIRVAFAVMLFATLELPRPRRAAAGVRMGADGRRGAALHASAIAWMIVCARASPSRSSRIGFNLLGDGLRDALESEDAERDEPTRPRPSGRGLRRSTTRYADRRRPAPSIDVTLSDRHAARCSGLVGESGSGKTSLAWAIMRYLPANAREVGQHPRCRARTCAGRRAAEIGASAAGASAWCSRTRAPRSTRP